MPTRERKHLSRNQRAKLDDHGHLVKKRFGPCMLPVFRALDKMKGLRGTPFDVFGKTDERRAERRLIGEYIALVDELCATLDRERLPVALKLAGLPDRIRGFGHEKEHNMAAVATEKAALVASYRASEPLAATA